MIKLFSLEGLRKYGDRMYEDSRLFVLKDDHDSEIAKLKTELDRMTDQWLTANRKADKYETSYHQLKQDLLSKSWDMSDLYEVVGTINEFKQRFDVMNEQAAEIDKLKKQLKRARELFSYEVDRNGCSDEIVMADTADEHEQAVENYVIEYFDNDLNSITAESIKGRG